MKSILVSVLVIISCNQALAYPHRYNYKCRGVYCYTGYAARGVRTPVAGDCTSFCECQFGYPVWISCPPGLHFNRGREKCDWPHKARCNFGYTTNPPYYTTTTNYYDTTTRPTTTRPTAETSTATYFTGGPTTRVSPPFTEWPVTETNTEYFTDTTTNYNYEGGEGPSGGDTSNYGSTTQIWDYETETIVVGTTDDPAW